MKILVVKNVLVAAGIAVSAVGFTPSFVVQAAPCTDLPWGDAYFICARQHPDHGPAIGERGPGQAGQPPQSYHCDGQMKKPCDDICKTTGACAG
jgi:hypothetical protein